jgi:hypothetical protein
MDLAVDIGFSYVVEINQCQFANTASGKRFDSPRTDSANSDNRNMRLSDARSTCYPIETLKPAKTTCNEALLFR